MSEPINFAPIKGVSTFGQMLQELSSAHGKSFAGYTVISYGFEGDPSRLVTKVTEGRGSHIGEIVDEKTVPKAVLDAVMETGLVLYSRTEDMVRVKEGIAQNHPLQGFLDLGYIHYSP